MFFFLYTDVFFNCVKACSQSSIQGTGFLTPFVVRLVRGTVMVENYAMKRRYHQTSPRKECTSFFVQAAVLTLLKSMVHKPLKRHRSPV